MTPTRAVEWFWQPAFSPWSIGAGATALAVLAVLAYGRAKLPGRPRTLLLGMRLLGVAALATLLLGPSRLSSTSPGGEIRGFLTAVPEPASWAMMIAGLAMVGGTMRRRGQALILA